MKNEQQRPGAERIGFLFGLVASLGIAIIALQWKSTAVNIPKMGKHKVEIPVTEDIPVTRVDLPKLPEIRKLSPIDPAKTIDPVDVLPPLDINSLKPVFTDPDPTGIVDIGMDSMETPEVVDVVFLEHIAVPADCGELSDRDARLRCTNLWLADYMSENLTYPERARAMNLEDKVYVSFVVDENGHITEVSLLKGEYEMLNAEAIRVLEQMPDWQPARQLHRKVRMRMLVPVSFKANP